ncbi:MAG: O-phospho-L-seryl-tRNA:Cys-tRNA synthase, partial [Methanosarcinales archaeon]|nr:O-phospho-L-seryl-tRNA:Cys-tRNA synthase [Methanosarcinales archaeon]
GGEMDRIKNPPIEEFVHSVLPEFLGIDQVRVTHGAREGMYAAMNALCRPGQTLVVDGNAHYTTILAAERCGLFIEYVPASPGPDYRVDPDGFCQAISRLREAGETPAMVCLTYPDGNYGNLVDARAVSRICDQEDLPFMLNGAYSVGRMPIKASEMGADIIVGSGHKSMASSGPIGILGASEEYASSIFRKSALKKNKEVELLGCTVRGAGMLTMMASFAHVAERTGHYDQEVENARWFSSRLGEMGIIQQGDRPHNHDLMFFKSDLLYEISMKAKKGRYFLYRDLKQRGVCGIKAGLTRQFKLSTYLLTRDELSAAADAFQEIIDSYA